MAQQLRVGIDVTPLLEVRTGIGRYVESLLAELAQRPGLQVSAAAFSMRNRSALSSLPFGVRAVHRPIPARLLQRAWRRADLPAAEVVLGRQDVVHGTNFVLPPPRRAAGVVTVHDLTFRRYPHLVDEASLAYRDLVPRALSRAAAVLVPTQAVAEEITAEYHTPADRLHITPLGVDPDWFGAAALPALPGFPTTYLLAVGTREPRKGLDVLLDAYRELISAEPDTPPLVLVGAPGWGPALSLQGIPDRQVVLAGFQPPLAVRALVAHAALLAFPSRYEGFGLPPLEALAAGTPVVASDVPAVREVLGEHAHFVPVDDAGALATALGSVLHQRPGQESLDAARAHAQTFTWERCADLTEAVYRRAAR